MPDSTNAVVRRAFVDLPHGQVHYRYSGDGPVLLLLHGSPGSSKQMEGLVARLARDFKVLSPDTPGNGDSTPLSLETPAIADFSHAILEFLYALDIDRADVYGTHTGACLASELALRAPQMVGKLIQDGVVIFSPEERRELLERYAHPFTPDLTGTHLMRAFLFCRDQFIFFPWYASDAEHMRDGGLPPPEALHEWVVEVLKAATSYHLAYRAAFAYLAEERLPLVQQPVLCVAAEDDPLGPGTKDIVPQLADGRFAPLPRYDAPDYLEALARSITEFVLG